MSRGHIAGTHNRSHYPDFRNCTICYHQLAQATRKRDEERARLRQERVPAEALQAESSPAPAQEPGSRSLGCTVLVAVGVIYLVYVITSLLYTLLRLS